MNKQLLRLLSTHILVHSSFAINWYIKVCKILYQRTLLMNEFCFCETYYLHFTTRVFGHSAITPSLLYSWADWPIVYANQIYEALTRNDSKGSNKAYTQWAVAGGCPLTNCDSNSSVSLIDSEKNYLCHILNYTCGTARYMDIIWVWLGFARYRAQVHARRAWAPAHTRRTQPRGPLHL